MLKVLEIRCEYLKNPIGISVKKPTFGWIIESDMQNVMQKTYRLQVATDDKFANVIWDTGVINSSEFVHVEYDGPVLKSSKRYFYRVKITDNYGQESLWSDIGYFETALMDVSEWKAKFITPEGENEGNSSKGKYLLHEYVLDGEIALARVCVTALGMYELYINGKRVGEDLFTPG